MGGLFTSFFFMLLLMTMLSTCSIGPPADQKCIPDDGTTNSGTNTPKSTSPGSGTSFAKQVDNMLKNGHIISTIVNDIKTQLIGGQGGYSSSAGIFQGFVNSADYQTAIGAAFSLFIIIYGMSVAVGMVQVSLGDAAIRVAKIGFIAAVALNWDVFYQSIGSFFIDGTDEMIGYFMDNFSSLYTVAGQSGSAPAGSAINGIFSGYDDLLARIFSFQTYAFVSALSHAGVYAPIYALFIMMTLMWVLQSILKVVQVYVFSLFAKSLLFAIAPIFLSFILFERTKPMFDAWLNQLVSFSLQPILITAYIGLFANLLTPFFDQFNTYKMCWNRLDGASDKYGWRFVAPGNASTDPIPYGSTTAPPIGLQAVLLFMFFAWLFKSALDMTDAMVVTIVSSAAGNLNELTGLRGFEATLGSNSSGQAVGNALPNLTRSN